MDVEKTIYNAEKIINDYRMSYVLILKKKSVKELSNILQDKLVEISLIRDELINRIG